MEKIKDWGVERYYLFMHFKGDDYVLFIGIFASFQWMEPVISDNHIENITFTAVEV